MALIDLDRAVIKFLSHEYATESASRFLWQEAGGDPGVFEWHSNSLHTWTVMFGRLKNGMRPSPLTLIQKLLEFHPDNTHLKQFLQGEETGNPMEQSKTQKEALIVTALEVEYRAVIHFLQGTRRVNTGKYHVRQGTYQDWTVSVASAGQGNEAVASLTQHLIEYFKPPYAFFVGVAGGRKDARHLDVVVGEQLLNVHSGKYTPQGFEVRPNAYRPGAHLLSLARDHAAMGNWVQPPVTEGAKAHIGQVAVTDGVVTDPEGTLGEQIAKHYGQTLAVEMEGYGFQLTANLNPDVKSLVVRGISDRLGDKHPAQDESFQPKAATNAAAFVFSLLSELSEDSH